MGNMGTLAELYEAPEIAKRLNRARKRAARGGANTQDLTAESSDERKVKPTREQVDLMRQSIWNAELTKPARS